jgi:polyisoprenoid-binding protein YceI
MKAPRSSRTFAAIGLAVALAFGGAAVPATTDPDTVRLVLRPGSRLWLEGDSNLHSWKCDAKEFVTELRLERASPTAPPRSIERATLGVPVAKIECGNGKMNANLRKALKSSEYADITFVVTGAEFVETASPGALEVLAKGHLYVAGNGRDLQFQVSGTDTGDGALRMRGRVQIKMTDFGVEPPTAMMGLLKTKDDVTISFDLITDYQRLEEVTSMNLSRRAAPEPL